MLKFRYVALPFLAFLLAACGTLPQTPTLNSDETNLESASYGGHLKYKFHKYVYGREYAPSNYYKFFIHCYKYNARTGQLGKAVLKKNFSLSATNLSLDSSAYGFQGYKCRVGEKAGHYYGKEYSVGDEVKVHVYQAHKHHYKRIYHDFDRYADRETYTSGWFYPKKGGKLFINFYNYYDDHYDDDDDHDDDDGYGKR